MLAALLPAVEAAEIWLFKLVVDDVLVPADSLRWSCWPRRWPAWPCSAPLLSFGDEYASTWVGERFTLALRAKVFRHLQRLEPDALDRRRHGDVLRGSPATCTRSRRCCCHALAEAVQAAARLLFFAGALFLLSWKLALASLIVIPPLYWAAKSFGRLARRAARERRRRSGERGRGARGGAGQHRARADRERADARAGAAAARERGRGRAPSSPARASPGCSRP